MSDEFPSARRRAADVQVRPHFAAGAGRGIGLAAAKLFVANGHRVVLSDLDLAEARVAFKDQAESVEFVEADVTDEPAVEAVFKVRPFAFR